MPRSSEAKLPGRWWYSESHSGSVQPQMSVESARGGEQEEEEEEPRFLPLRTQTLPDGEVEFSDLQGFFL